MTQPSDVFLGHLISSGADEPKQIYFVRTKSLTASEPGLWKTEWRRQKWATKPFSWQKNVPL